MATPYDVPSSAYRTHVHATVPRRSSRRLRAAHTVLHATVRRFFEFAAWIDERRLVPPSVLLAVCRLADPALYLLRPRRGTRLRLIQFGNFRAEWTWDRTSPDPFVTQDAAILYLHGGGLLACGLNTHRRLVARLAREAGVPLLNVDYRQIPQAHVTETLEDCLTAYNHLLDQGFSPDRIVLAGDSAGGGLAFSLALALRDRGLPIPAGIVGISPWANYDSALRLAHPNDRTEAALPARAYALPVKWGVMVDGVLDPTWSPVNHRFDGLPPVMVQVGSTEVVRSDTELLALRCAEAGVPMELQFWDNAFHVFQVAADVLPDARDAIADLAEFIRSRVKVTASDWTHRVSA